MAKTFLPYDLDQQLLLPPDLRDWLEPNHLARFVVEIVGELDLAAIYRVYLKEDARGRRGFHPAMMVSLLIYGYCMGITSSRKIEKATYDDVAFRVLAGDQHPDHDSIANFRKVHLPALSGLFFQVLRLCQKAGLVKLGHIAIDGTKMKANASKHKAMSYGRMTEAEAKLAEEVEALLAEAERVDAEEDAHFGKGKRGDELPEELRRREDRLKKIRAAKAELEREAKERATTEAAEAKKKLAERAEKEAQTATKARGKAPEVPNPQEAKPDPKSQRNFTDPDSRIMPDGAHKGAFIQAYNAQIAVDSEAQIIVAAALTQQANDKLQLVPMAEQVVANVGRLADVTTADAGYFSAENIQHPAIAGTKLLVPPNREKRLLPTPAPTETSTPAEKMRFELSTPEGKNLYKMRKAIVEPVNGQIKSVRGLRGVSLRGLVAASCEFNFIALTHNLLKLFRYGGFATA
jgi:transposase